MTILKIEPFDNGAHANQSTDVDILLPDGWAVIPPDMEIPDTFPFVDIEVDLTQIPPVVTKMTAGIVQPSEPDLVPAPTVEARLDAIESAMLAMMMEG